MSIFIFFRLLRVEQYVKNFFVLLPLFFSGSFTDTQALIPSLLMFLAFCAASSIVYIINDILDVHEDRNHPTKRNRPFASGKISLTTALIVAFILFCIAFSVSWGISKLCFAIIIAYLALNTFYVFYGKHCSLLDVACIAIGFVLRTMSGGFASHTPASHWLVLMVFLLCMFLGLGKRWDDLCITEKGTITGTVRKSLQNYSKTFVLTAMTFLSTINSVCYISYTLSPQIIAQYNSSYVYITSFWVVLGNLRYLQLAFVNEDCSSPTRIVLQDRGIQSCILFWLLHMTYLIYA